MIVRFVGDPNGYRVDRDQFTFPDGPSRPKWVRAQYRDPGRFAWVNLAHAYFAEYEDNESEDKP